MDSNTILEISYVDLKDMLDEAQRDAINADGCWCGVHYNADEEIQYGIKYGTIRIKED